MTCNAHQTLITASGTADSPNTWGSPGVHRLPGRTEAFVIARNDADGAARDELAEHIAPGEWLGTQPPWVPCGLMDMPTLGAFMEAHLHTPGTSVWRMECLPFFAGDPDYQRWLDGEGHSQVKLDWMDRLRRDDANGIEHLRVRRFARELSRYERYAAQRGHGPNHEAGERHFVLHEGEHDIPAGLMLAEYWIVNRTIAVPMLYDGRGEFIGAGWLDAERSRPFVDDWNLALTVAEPWDTWWARNVELHEPASAAA